MHSRFVKHHADTDAATLNLGEGSDLPILLHLSNTVEFAKTHCLINSEVLLLLEDIQERRREEAMTLPLPPPSK